MESRILVAYASNAGSTADVAKAVGEELSLSGMQVDVRPIRDLDGVDLSLYSGVVVGAPMILGWHRSAEKFVKAHQAELARVPVAFFATAMSLTATRDRAQGLPRLRRP